MKVAIVFVALCIAAAYAQSGFRINSLPLIVTTEKLCKVGDGSCPWMDAISDPINLKVSGAADKRFLTLVVSTVSTIWGDTHVHVDGGMGSHKDTSADIARIEIQTVVKEKQSDGQTELVPVYPPHATTFERSEILTMQEYDVECLETTYQEVGCNNGTETDPDACCPDALTDIERESIATSWYFFAHPFKTGNVELMIQWRCFYDVTSESHAGGTMGPIVFEAYTGQMEESDSCKENAGTNCDI
mgnify:CR=1 FL=1|tara:strand:- start:1217 stop:1951 length:735 start_codon:yes stop_codon:yes gene_type:complete